MATYDRMQVPSATIQRLPVYLRCLLSAQAAQQQLINSDGLAQMAGSNAAQVRKDLSYFGELGTRGLGYDVDELVSHLLRLLGIEERRRVAIVGFGRLGGALQSYPGFSERGFEVAAVVDADPDKVGGDVGGLTVRHIDELADVIESEGIDLVVVTTPAEAAQSVADVAVAAGVRAILNLAPVSITVPDGVLVRHADLAVELQVLSFHLSRGSAEGR